MPTNHRLSKARARGVLRNSIVWSLTLSCSFSGLLLCQQAPTPSGQQAPPTGEPPQPMPGTPKTPQNNPPGPQDKRIFGVLPNYRTAGAMAVYSPITPGQKFKIAAQDSIGWNIALLAGAFAGLAQIEASEPAFGQGVAGYARYFGTAYADQFIGNFMTEAIFPTMLHEDPRYFRIESGSAKHRIGGAVAQIFWTRKDKGGHEFNYSEIVGNAVGTAISNAYYPNTRDVSDNLTKWGTAVGTDLVSNILKEYWPDFKRKFLHKDHNEPNSSDSLSPAKP